MKTKTSLIAAAVALGLAAPMTMGATAAYAQCTNGERIVVKNEINRIAGSALVEEKQYQGE